MSETFNVEFTFPDGTLARIKAATANRFGKEGDPSAVTGAELKGLVLAYLKTTVKQHEDGVAVASVTEITEEE